MCNHEARNDAKPAAMVALTVDVSAIAATVAAQGGSTFQMNMFSTV